MQNWILQRRCTKPEPSDNGIAPAALKHMFVGGGSFSGSEGEIFVNNNFEVFPDKGLGNLLLESHLTRRGDH